MEKTQLKSKQIAEILNKNGIYIDEPIATKMGLIKQHLNMHFLLKMMNLKQWG